jgi:hypothetical protein
MFIGDSRYKKICRCLGSQSQAKYSNKDLTISNVDIQQFAIAFQIG